MAGDGRRGARAIRGRSLLRNPVTTMWDDAGKKVRDRSDLEKGLTYALGFPVWVAQARRKHDGEREVSIVH